MNKQSMPLVHLEGVCCTLEGQQVLHDISFSLTTNRVGVVGRNGSGKSTLARLIAGLIAPDSGNVRVCGVDVARDRAGAIGAVGLLFQNPDHQIIFPTVLEEVMFGLRQQGYSKPEGTRLARQTLGDFGKSHWEESSVQTLSQGQRHLLCLIAVLAMKPKVLLLDEPFAGLDLSIKMQLGRYLEMSEAALVHISHDPDDLKGYDEVVWIDAGRVKEKGAAGLVLQHYRQEMIRMGGGDDISDITG